jgi:hypothetical protein
MSTLVYHVVEHDGGWAYQADGSFSETFRTRDAAHRAALRAAGEQRAPGETEPILYEDAEGQWREALSEGGDRPRTEVDDTPL